jgi:IPT/TIG domain
MPFTQAPGRHSEPRKFRSRILPTLHPHKSRLAKSALLAIGVAVFVLACPASPLYAQSTTPHISTVSPNSGKSDDSITITGTNLGKSEVKAVFLSDSKLDYKAIVVDQEPTKIVIKVPQLKPGNYNISVQEGGAIYIQPVIFKVTS